MATSTLTPRHAIYIGWVVGCALRNEVPVKPVVDENGFYTDRIRLCPPGFPEITLIVPEPPADWSLAEAMSDD